MTLPVAIIVIAGPPAALKVAHWFGRCSGERSAWSKAFAAGICHTRARRRRVHRDGTTPLERLSLKSYGEGAEDQRFMANVLAVRDGRMTDRRPEVTPKRAAAKWEN